MPYTACPSTSRCSVKKGVLKNFANVTGKDLCWSLFLMKNFINFIKKRLQHWCCPVIYAKFLRTPIFKDTCDGLLLITGVWVWYFLWNFLIFERAASEKPQKCATLTLSWRRSLLYRNQSIDLPSNSMDWFLYHRDLHHEGDKKLTV